jgi:hypothetical protein
LQKALICEWEELPMRQAIQRGIGRFAEAWESDEPRLLMGEFVRQRRARRA